MKAVARPITSRVDLSLFGSRASLIIHHDANSVAVPGNRKSICRNRPHARQSTYLSHSQVPFVAHSVHQQVALSNLSGRLGSIMKTR